MGRYKQPYSIYKRDTGYYYYRTYDELGRRTVAKSTGKTSQVAAVAWCEMLLRQGRLIHSGTMTFMVYAEPWWDWDRCKYVRSKVARDEHGDGLSREYVTRNRGIMKQYLVPHFGRYGLDQITRELVDDWLLSLAQRVSYKYANNIFGVLSVMLHEAVNRRLIRFNPCSAVSKLKARSKTRDLYTGEELKLIMNPQLWGGVTPGFLANILSASTGMRFGEIRALLREDYHGAYIHVRRNITNSGRIVRVKNKEERLTPVPSKVQGYIEEGGYEEGYLISKTEGRKPLPLYEGRRTLYEVLDKIGIDETTRDGRGLTFHAWRHWFNTVMRAGAVPDIKVKSVTGHKTSAMMDHYTSFRREDYADVIAVQDAMWR